MGKEEISLSQVQAEVGTLKVMLERKLDAGETLLKSVDQLPPDPASFRLYTKSLAQGVYGINQGLYSVLERLEDLLVVLQRRLPPPPKDPGETG